MDPTSDNRPNKDGQVGDEGAGFTIAGQSQGASAASTSTSATATTFASNSPSASSTSAQPSTSTAALHPNASTIASTTTETTTTNPNLDPTSQSQTQNQTQAQAQPTLAAHNSDVNKIVGNENKRPVPSNHQGLASDFRSDPSSSLSQPQRVVPQPSVSPNPAPDSTVTFTSSSYSVVKDDPETTHHAHRYLPASASASAASSQANQPPNQTTNSPSNDITRSSSPPTTHVAPQDYLKRSSTYPQPSPARDNVEYTSHQATADVASPPARRAPSSRGSFGVTTSDARPTNLRTKRTHSTESASSAVTSPEVLSPRSSAGQRELLLLKSLSNSSPPDERRASTHRPPVSYKPPANAASSQNGASTPVRVPPIRSFRSSGSRKSLTLDMNYTPQPYDLGDDNADGNYDRTLRALEGRRIQDMLQMTPPSSARQDGPEADDGGDVFLRIAREEGSRRSANQDQADETQSSASRVYRTHRRPQSTNVASYTPKSPPYMSRRMSDHQERSRSRHDDDRASEITRSMTQRIYTREKAASVHPADDSYRSRQGGAALRPSPITPRSQGYTDLGSDNPVYSRRRPSITESTPPVRSSNYRSAGHGHTHGKSSYNSSPLVRSFDFRAPHPPEGGQGMDGTESTASTTAPSTVWDELDDLKSRIHRLELTGKLPSTSAAAVSRLSDERPPTATTTMTTVSSSPKRNVGNQQVETASTTSSHKESYPVLQAALVKSKPFLAPDIHRALEAAANDAMSMVSLMGQPGQPGPISSGASTIGSGTTITDRQLRRKADSVCRSLTELAVALGEDTTHSKPAQASHSQKLSQGHAPTQYFPSAVSQTDGPSTPTINKTYHGLHSRRPSNTTDILPKPSTSPTRTLSKFEERRNTILNGTTLPSPRTNGSNPPTPQDSATNRRSSLMVSRTRRALTEEPEEVAGRRSSVLLRSRRGGTEEPEEGRQTSMLRSRRGTMEDSDTEPRFSAPSRAYTEVNATRGPAREYTEVAASTRAPTREYASQLQSPTQPQLQAPIQDSPSHPPTSLPTALPRRRFVSTNTHTSRLPAAPSALPTRNYLERSPAPAVSQEREPANYTEKPIEARPQRYYSLNQGMALSRTGSLSTRRQNRDSTISNTSTTAAAGGYR